MPTINQLQSVDSPNGSDLLPLYSQSNGDARKLSLTNLLTWIKNNFTSPEYIKQTAAPNGSGFTVYMDDNANNQWLVMQPVAGYATGTIVLPDYTTATDGQELIVCSSQAVTTLTINAGGATVVGAPTAFTAGGYFRLRYDNLSTTWFRVG